MDRGVLLLHLLLPVLECLELIPIHCAHKSEVNSSCTHVKVAVNSGAEAELLVTHLENAGQLAVLDLSSSRLGIEGAVTLSRLLPHTVPSTVKILKLGHTQMGLGGALWIMDALMATPRPLPQLTQLSLEHNALFGSPGGHLDMVDALAELLLDPTRCALVHLDLAGCMLGPQGLARLSRAIAARPCPQA